MGREIFSDVARPSVRLGSRAWYTLPVSIAAHAVIAAVVIVIPLMATDVLPAPASLGVFVTSPPPPVPPPLPPAAAPDQRRPAPTAVNPNIVLTEPAERIVEESAPPSIPGAPGGIEGVPAGVPGSIGPIPAMPPVPSAPAPPKPVPVGGRIKNPAKIKDVRPVYPAIAGANRVEGRVIIQAIIGADGLVQDARVVGSVPLLDRAALDAVMQWQFSPTLLNGIPIPGIMTVTVNFTLK